MRGGKELFPFAALQALVLQGSARISAIAARKKIPASNLIYSPCNS